MYVIPKVIYLSYHKLIPVKVLHSWKVLNPTYKIEFSLDKDCVEFMDTHFSKSVSAKFKSMPRGAYKCDLWRLCKLYIEGGVYADVDLVPHASIDHMLKDNHSFYSCMGINNRAIFQAFMATTVNNPIILACIISFMHNEPDKHTDGPTFDMYNVLSNIYNTRVVSDHIYTSDSILVRVHIGPSIEQTKTIELYRQFPEYSKIILEYNNSKDTFSFAITDDTLTVTRTDRPSGWGNNHYAFIQIQSTQSVFLFQEYGKYKDAHVRHDGIRLFNSRSPSYMAGW